MDQDSHEDEELGSMDTNRETDTNTDIGHGIFEGKKNEDTAMPITRGININIYL